MSSTIARLTRLERWRAQTGNQAAECFDAFHYGPIDYRELGAALAPVDAGVTVPLCPSCGHDRNVVQIVAIEPRYPAA